MIVVWVLVAVAAAAVVATVVCLIALVSAGVTSEYEHRWEESPMYTLERKYRQAEPDQNVGIQDREETK